VADAEDSARIRDPERKRLAKLAPKAGLVIAADRGAEALLSLGLLPDILVGDMDSVEPSRLEALPTSVQVLRFSRDKDETDLELALLEAVRRAPESAEMLILLALGGRMDHSLANLQLAARPELAGRRLRFLSGDQTLWPIIGPAVLEIDGATGDTVSLLPLGDGVRIAGTRGLQWPLEAAWLAVGPARGISNRMTEERAVIEVAAGFLLCVHIPVASRML
jgi:thiamine pyrophosphokinase